MAGHGCNTHTQRRRPKPRGPGPTARVTGIWRSLCARRQTERTPVNPKAVVKLPERRKARKPEMLCRPPGVSRSKPINTARGTLERRRTCGFKTTGRRPRPGSPFRFGVARCRSPWVRSTPGVPRALGLIRERNRPNDSGAEALRERRRLFEIESNYTVCALRNDDSIRVPLV